jgi:DNA-binding transcriptional MerR regulator
MNKPIERRHSIGEVSKLLEVPIYTLRQWEESFPQLRPKRDRVKRRYYLNDDIEIVRRIKQLLWHEKLTIEGARIRLTQELLGQGRPKTNQEIFDLIDEIERQIRDMIHQLDHDPAEGA